MPTKRIKICHIITRMDRGGAPDIVRLIIERTPPDRFDSFLLYGPTVYPTEKTRSLLAALGDKAIVVETLRRDINLFLDTRAIFDLRRQLEIGKFDLVHLHTGKAGFLGRIAAKLAGVPAVVYSPHGLDFYGYGGPLFSQMIIWAERTAARFCDRIHALTDLEKKEMLRHRVGSAPKIDVIYSGVVLDGLKFPSSQKEIFKLRFTASRESFLVGFVGRLEPVKGPQYFIEAAKGVLQHRDDVIFLVAGDGSLREALEAQSRELGIENKVVFTGWIEDVTKVLVPLDVVVLPSLNESVGRSLLEAQALGVPVVAARVGGVPEVVRDGVTGILVEPRSPQALAGAILVLLADRNKRTAMSEAARGWVDKRFSADVMGRGIVAMYDEVLRSKLCGSS